MPPPRLLLRAAVAFTPFPASYLGGGKYEIYEERKASPVACLPFFHPEAFFFFFLRENIKRGGNYFVLVSIRCDFYAAREKRSKNAA